MGFLGDVLGTAADLKGAFGGGLESGLIAFEKVVAEGFLVISKERGELGMGVNGEDFKAVEDWF